MINRKKIDTDKMLDLAFLILVFVAILPLLLIQPFGDPPDEINRFKVVYYICNHGILPNGYEKEILLDGYGGSYAFQPILTYIIEGYLLRWIRNYTANTYALIVAARLVNAVFGVAMAWFIRQISKKIWDDKLMQWIFTVGIVFLPQQLFMHTYVNTDSMALLSISMIVYAMILGEEDDFKGKTGLLLAIGIILCAMSYYNAYGIVLCAILWFLYHFISQKKYQEMFLTGGLIAGIVLLGISWWFIRNGVLYHGDILGMKARSDCALQTALPEFNPLTRFTYYRAGKSLADMFRENEFVKLSYESFVAMYGPMRIPTHGLIYIYYKRLFVPALIFACIPIVLCRLFSKEEIRLSKKTMLDRGILQSFDDQKRKKDRWVLEGLLLADACITMGLHIYYSYTWEYQPQGRYLLPMVVSLIYFVSFGIWKAITLFRFVVAKIAKLLKEQEERVNQMAIYLVRCGQLLIIAFVLITLAYTLTRKVIPVYLSGSNLMQMSEVPFTDIMP